MPLQVTILRKQSGNRAWRARSPCHQFGACRISPSSRSTKLELHKTLHLMPMRVAEGRELTQAERTSTLLLRRNATSLLDCRQCSLASVNPHPQQQLDHLSLRNKTDISWCRCRSSDGNLDMEKCQLLKEVLIRSWNITFLTIHRD